MVLECRLEIQQTSRVSMEGPTETPDQSPIGEVWKDNETLEALIGGGGESGL